MTNATMKIRNRRAAARRMRNIEEVVLFTLACLGTALLAVGAVAITIARYHAGI